jgi:hypothetical protein
MNKKYIIENIEIEKENDTTWYCNFLLGKLKYCILLKGRNYDGNGFENLKNILTEDLGLDTKSISIIEEYKLKFDKINEKEITNQMREFEEKIKEICKPLIGKVVTIKSDGINYKIKLIRNV